MTFLSCALFTVGASVQAQAATADNQEGALGDAIELPETEPELSQFRGSEIIFGNVVGVGELNRSASLTYNPYYALTFSFRPRVWFGEIASLGARLDVTRELTEADETTYANEWVFDDLYLVGGATDFYTIPGAEITLSTDVRVIFPTSKVSRGRTLMFAIAPSLSIGREIDLGAAGNLSISYGARFTGNLHRNTTAELETPLIRGCNPEGGGCDAFLNTGLRNARFRVSHGVGLVYTALPWLEFSADFLHIVDWLYAIEQEDQRATYEPLPDTNQRFRSRFSLELLFTPTPMLTIAVGYDTWSPQLAPDSTYYNPFFNRYSTLRVDLGLQMDGLIEHIRSKRTQ